MCAHIAPQVQGLTITTFEELPLGVEIGRAVESDSDKMHDVCDASLYKNSIVPASNDTREPKNMLN